MQVEELKVQFICKVPAEPEQNELEDLITAGLKC